MDTPTASPPLADRASADRPRIEAFLLYLMAERGLSQNTIAAYRRDLQDLSSFLADRCLTVASASAAELQEYLRTQSRAGLASSTVCRRLAAIRSFLKFLASEGNKSATSIAQLERPKLPRALPKILSKAQMAALLSAPDRASPLFARDVAILELLYAAGLRASELCQLKQRDINLSQRCVRVLGKGSKERLVPIGQAAADAIARYLTECRPKLLKKSSELVFVSQTGKPLSRIALWTLVEKFARRAGILKNVSPHTLRHCFATHLIGGGADLRVVQELLGHSDVGTTQIYTHVDTERLKLVHGKFHPRA